MFILFLCNVLFFFFNTSQFKEKYMYKQWIDFLISFITNNSIACQTFTPNKLLKVTFYSWWLLLSVIYIYGIDKQNEGGWVEKKWQEKLCRLCQPSTTFFSTFPERAASSLLRNSLEGKMKKHEHNAWVDSQ